MQDNVTSALASRRSAADEDDQNQQYENLKIGRESNHIGKSTWRVHNLLTALELVFESWTAMSARGLFLTYAIPSISSVLHKTGGFDKDVARRYADMELLIREFNESAVDGTTEFDGQPDRAKVAILRLNAIHQEYSSLITYRDMVYVLIVFATTPSLWFQSRWSWRRSTEEERECIYYHWCDIGQMMGLDIKDHFHCWDDMLQYKRAFETKHMRYALCNKLVSHSTVEFFLQGVVPMCVHGVVRPVVLQLLSAMQEFPEHAAALGLPKANPLVLICVDFVLTLRALFCRYLLPPRPLRWIERLTGRASVKIELGDSYPFNTGGQGGCPFSLSYRPTRGLDFNNNTYTPQSEGVGTGNAYVIENMGPKHITSGKLCTNPRYLGHDERKIL